MTDRDDLADRLDAVEEDLGDTSTRGIGTAIVYTDGDGYVTPDGDPVPTDATGEPDPPNARGFGTTIVLDGRYVEDAPDAVDDARGDA